MRAIASMFVMCFAGAFSRLRTHAFPRHRHPKTIEDCMLWRFSASQLGHCLVDVESPRQTDRVTTDLIAQLLLALQASRTSPRRPSCNRHCTALMSSGRPVRSPKKATLSPRKKRTQANIARAKQKKLEKCKSNDLAKQKESMAKDDSLDVLDLAKQRQSKERLQDDASQLTREAHQEKQQQHPFRVDRGIFDGLDVAKIAEEVDFKCDMIKRPDRNNRSRIIEVPESRLTAWYSDVGRSFSYSNKTMPCQGSLTPTLATVRNELEARTGIRYDSILVNYYEDGRAGMRWHSDPLQSGTWDELTSIVSIGAPRTFSMRKKDNFTVRWNYRIFSGDVVTMLQGCQHDMQHCIKQEPYWNPVGPRISLVYKRLACTGDDAD